MLLDMEMFALSLEMLNNGKLEELKPVQNNNVDFIQYNLIPNHPYLFYNINEEYSRRGMFQDTMVCIGYYNPTPYIHPYDNILYEDMIKLNYTICLSYRTRGTHIPPFDFFKNELDKNEDGFITQYIEDSFSTDEIYYNMRAFKLPFPPFRFVGQHIVEIQNELEEMMWIPEENKNIPFIGSKYRMQKQEFEKCQLLEKHNAQK